MCNQFNEITSMPACQICQKFFRDSLMPLHKYRQNAPFAATTAIVNGASLSLTSIGQFMPGCAQVKNKINSVGQERVTEDRHRSCGSGSWHACREQQKPVLRIFLPVQSDAQNAEE
jgi:hypothetical protein